MKRKKCVKSPEIKFEDFCTLFVMSDDKEYRISQTKLEKLWNEALNANKRPLIVVGIRRNDKEVFMITGEVKLENQRRAK